MRREQDGVKHERNVIIQAPTAKHATSNLVFPPSCTDAPHRPSVSYKDEDGETNLRRSKHHTRTHRRYGHQGKDEKRSSTTSKSAKLIESPSDSESNLDASHRRNLRNHRSKDEGLQVICRLENRFQEALEYNTYSLADKASKYDDPVATSLAKFAKRLQLQTKTNIFDSFDPLP